MNLIFFHTTVINYYLCVRGTTLPSTLNDELKTNVTSSFCSGCLVLPGALSGIQRSAVKGTNPPALGPPRQAAVELTHVRSSVAVLSTPHQAADGFQSSSRPGTGGTHQNISLLLPLTFGNRSGPELNQRGGGRGGRRRVSKHGVADLLPGLAFHLSTSILSITPYLPFHRSHLHSNEEAPHAPNSCLEMLK